MADAFDLFSGSGPAPVFQADPAFVFQSPQRPCGVLGSVLGRACGGCVRCSERPPLPRVPTAAKPLRGESSPLGCPC